MTRQERRYAGLIKRGYFLSEAKAWSGFDQKDAPWYPKMVRDRTKLVKQWARQQKVDLSTVEPLDLRKSLTYQRLVRQFYDSHGWTKERVRWEPSGKKVTYSIDPYQMMRHYSDTYQPPPGGTKYMPPWRKREHTKREKDAAIDRQFSTAPGLMTI